MKTGWLRRQTQIPKPKPSKLADEVFPGSFECVKLERKPRLSGNTSYLATQLKV